MQKDQHQFYQVYDRSFLGAAGAVESIAAILAMEHGMVPPTINHSTVDETINPEVKLDPEQGSKTRY